jgi:hypothetical protein
MDLAGITDTSQVPPNLPTDEAEQEKWLLNLAKHFVDFVWSEVPAEEIRIVISSMKDNLPEQNHEPFRFCHCNASKNKYIKID